MSRFVKDNYVDRRNIKLSARLTEESTCTLTFHLFMTFRLPLSVHLCLERQSGKKKKRKCDFHPANKIVIFIMAKMQVQLSPKRASRSGIGKKFRGSD